MCVLCSWFCLVNRYPGILVLKMGALAQETVPEDPGDPRITCVEASSHAPLGVVEEVLGIMAPPGAVVVPEMVERVAGGPDGKNCSIDCAHGCDVWVVTPGTRAIKKRRSDQERRFIKPGEIFVRRISPAAHRKAFTLQPPWDFSVPGWHPLVSSKGIPDVGNTFSTPIHSVQTTCVS